jgi:bifunctional non-homologous end joining protein LigD
MMAYSVADPPSGDHWLYEIKWDGVRAICFIENQRLRMISRNGNSFDRQYPELSVVPNYVKADTAILDGEIAVVDEKGRSNFGLIQPRIHQTDPNAIAHLVRGTPVKLFVFDLLYLNGYDLRPAALIDRKRLLKQILEPSQRLQYSEHFAAQGEQMLEAARHQGLEGVMAKLENSKYESRRSRSWLKIKVSGRQEFVICGYTHGERDTFSSLVLGLRDKDEWVYVGNVGTGFNEQSLGMLLKKLRPLEIPKSPFAKRPIMARRVTWVKPELVAEIKFAEWTRDGKLRAPVYMGLRTDKRAEDCVLEAPPSPAPIKQIAQKVSKKTPGKTPGRKTALLDASAKEQTIDIDGITLKFSNLDKVFYPKNGYTKRDVLNYYDAVADLLLPHLKGRPLSLKRYPNGIDKPFFFQKNMAETFPEWIRTEPIHSEHRGEPIRYALAENRASLLYLTNLGCIDQNPWLSRIGSLECPDFVLIDLDPQQCPYDMIVEAAQLVREKLELAGLQGYPKTTGGDGMHIYIPVESRYTYDQVRSFAEVLSQIAVKEQPDLFTTPRSVAKRRKGRVYFDYMQIGSSKTIAAPYVLRAYNGAPVSTPLEWKEVKKGLLPEQFTIVNAVERFTKLGDIFAPVLSNPQKLEPALRKLTSAFGG